MAQEARRTVATEKLPAGIAIVAVEAFPPQIELKSKYDYRQLLLTGKTATGELVDVTRIAVWKRRPIVHWSTTRAWSARRPTVPASCDSASGN